jgi:integrase
MATMSASAIGKLRPGQELRDRSVPGFGIRAHESGASWFLAYQLANGQRRRLKLGSYPATLLPEARKRAREARGRLEAGEDPAAADASLTLLDAFQAYREKELARFRSGAEMAKDLNRDLVASLGQRPLTSIGRTDLATVLDTVEARGPIQANRVLQYTKAMFRRFVERGLIEQSRASRLRERTRERPRERIAAPEELAALWQACDRDGTWFGALIQLLVLTGMRRGEPFAGRLEPTSRRLIIEATKQGIAHLVTLPTQAVEPAQRFLNDPVRAARVKSLGWSKRWPKLLRSAGLPTAAFRIHDLKRTWATTAAELEVDPFAIELCLGHVPSGVLGKVGATYNRHKYEKRCAEGGVRREAQHSWALW